jgi:Family of unknown function (DUF6435)
MFKLFTKDPLKDLQKKRNRLLEEAMLTQRTGNLRLYAEKVVEIENLEKEIELLQPAPSAKVG